MEVLLLELSNLSQFETLPQERVKTSSYVSLAFYFWFTTTQNATKLNHTSCLPYHILPRLLSQSNFRNHKKKRYPESGMNLVESFLECEDFRLSRQRAKCPQILQYSVHASTNSKRIFRRETSLVLKFWF